MLRAEVLRYANDVRSPDAIGLPKPAKADAKQVRELAKEIDSLSEDRLAMSEMEDIEAGALLKLAQRKAKSGKGVIAMEALEDLDDDGAAGGEVIDLMEILRKSLGAKAAPAKAPASKSAAKGVRTKGAASAKAKSATRAAGKRSGSTRSATAKKAA